MVDDETRLTIELASIAVIDSSDLNQLVLKINIIGASLQVVSTKSRQQPPNGLDKRSAVCKENETMAK